MFTIQNIHDLVPHLLEEGVEEDLALVVGDVLLIEFHLGDEGVELGFESVGDAEVDEALEEVLVGFLGAELPGVLVEL